MQVPAYQVLSNDADKQPFSPQDKPARWTSGQAPAVYCSCQATTALVEYLAHLESSLPDTLACARVTLAGDQIETLEVLPEHWRQRPYRASVQSVGDAWLGSYRSLALRVPSVLCPAAYNLILNPDHPDFTALRVEFCEMFRLDDRLAR